MADRGHRLYSVSIETWGEGLDAIDDDALVELAPVLSDFGAVGAASSAGGLAGGPGATFSVPVGSVRTVSDEDLLAGVVSQAVGWFNAACDKVNLTHSGIACLDVMTDDYLERELSQEPEAYAGVSEVAKLLGVSRQRVFELRTRGDFPTPVADLAAGPVWRLSTLKRFISEWPRKPGRPRKKPGA